MGVKRLYAYSLAGQLDEHEFSDDVAVCWASSIHEAIWKFRKMYARASKHNVKEVSFNDKGVAVLTEY